ncbi:H+/gluconate symporter-like permease [Pseudonocardia sediminis]|uniref:H+/gluconate symporter-like permease n=1 Tax=Pseudonocardia sediminis TaxID=1397368 RepID=A0A4Q7UVC2_PSEST|nr:SLC13 family permease [Pseudonocardia sediminis]RZT85927.1 H+/gluconate symporter-like permease [Pseudonocardia sediminis]
MSDTAIIVNTVVAVLATVLLIVRFRLNPVVSLVIGAAYLGLTAGLGVEGTVEAITGGFGDILAEVGLLIAFGVLTGAMLQRAGAIERLVAMLLRVCGPRGMPYATAVTVGTVLQSIFVDVLLVISAPLARRLAPRIGDHGLPRMATALAIGLECGIVLMVPGVGALALAGLLGVPLGTMLLAGFVLVVPTVLIATAIMTFVFRRGWWDPIRDEQAELAAAGPVTGGSPAGGPSTDDAGPAATAAAPDREPLAAAAAPSSTTLTDAGPMRRDVSLLLLFTPLLVALLLIAAGAVLEVAEVSVPVLAFVAEPVIALLIGLIGTTVVCSYATGRTAVEESVAGGFRESGQILILTGVGGSLATTIQKAGLGDILGQYFSATTVAPLLMVWVIAAVLHVAIGSVTISAITAAGVLAPVAPIIGLSPVLVALAAGAGSLFAVHVTSNTFWLLQSLMGQTTRGALKTCSVGVSVASVVAIGIILPMSLVF